MELENLLIDESGAEKIEEVRKFKDLIRPKSANDVVWKTQDNQGREVSGFAIFAQWLAILVDG